MNNLQQAAQQALEVLLEYQPNPCLIPETQEETDRAAAFWDAIGDLRAALAEPQTTHWEGCEAVHPECRKQEQEPVAWAVYDILHGGSKTLHWPEQHSPNGDPKQYKAVPLYTAPTPRKPLTGEEMRECAQAMNAEPLAEGWPELIKFARAIERAHGIGEQHGS